MKNELVFTKRDEVWSDSLTFSKEFGIAHAEVRRKIKNLTMEDETMTSCFKESEFINSRGRTYKNYLISEQGIDILAGATRSKKNKLADKVYLMQSEFNMKVGITNDVVRREKILNTANPHGVAIISCYRFSVPSQASRIEMMIHDKLKDIRMNGEWFDSKKFNTGAVGILQLFNANCLNFGGIDITEYVTEHHPSDDEI